MGDCCSGKELKVTFKDLVTGRLAISLVQTYSRIQMLEDACTFNAICDGDRGLKLREELVRQEEGLDAIMAEVNLDEEIDPYLASMLMALNQEESVCRNQRADLLFDTVLGINEDDEEDDVDDHEHECTCDCGDEEEVEEEEALEGDER